MVFIALIYCLVVGIDLEIYCFHHITKFAPVGLHLI